MTQTPHLNFGAEGEQLAAKFLIKKGYKIIGRNLKIGGVEIDILAKYGKTVILVEVKTRHSEFFGAPELAVTDFKLKRLSRAAAFYARHQPNLPIRLDIIAILKTGTGVGQTRLRHYKGVGETAELVSFD